MMTAGEILHAKTLLPRHLGQLESLLGRPVAAEDLLSLDETEAIRARALATTRSPQWGCQIGFAEKNADRFQSLVRRLSEQHAVGVFLWTPLANSCGVLRPVPLSDIRWEFDYALFPEGILVILGADLEDQLLLDFSEDPQGERVVEIEGAGRHWGEVKY